MRKLNQKKKKQNTRVTIKKSENSKYWQDRGVTGIFIYAMENSLASS